jgi:hypothetical protein
VPCQSVPNAGPSAIIRRRRIRSPFPLTSCSSPPCCGFSPCPGLGSVRSPLVGLSLPRHGPMAARAPAAQPEGSVHVAADRPAGARLPAQTPDPSSVAESPLCHHTPKVGAVCLNWASVRGARSNERPYRDRSPLPGLRAGCTGCPAHSRARCGRCAGVIAGTDDEARLAGGRRAASCGLLESEPERAPCRCSVSCRR